MQNKTDPGQNIFFVNRNRNFSRAGDLPGLDQRLVSRLCGQLWRAHLGRQAQGTAVQKYSKEIQWTHRQSLPNKYNRYLK